jgi:hypothetical protein
MLVWRVIAAAFFMWSAISFTPVRLKTADSFHQKVGYVYGSVLDINGAAIVRPQATVVFKGRDSANANRVKVDADGRYKVALPPGIYQVSFELNVSSELNDIYPYRRSPFRIDEDSSILINLVIRDLFLVRGITVLENEVVDKLAPEPKYEILQLAKTAKLPAPPLIQFQGKRSAGNGVEFEDAALTYDMNAIYADRIHVDKRRKLILASGKRVIVEDGKERVEVKSVEVDFKGATPTIRITK